MTSPARAAFRALTAPRKGPTIYDLCDPLLAKANGGDPHLHKFYRTAIRNPVLRPVLARAGVPELRDPSRFRALQDAIAAARDQTSPDWRAVGRPLAGLLDAYPQRHPSRPPLSAPARAVSLADIDLTIRICARHLIHSHARNGFIPGYAAFNLIGDPDVSGGDFLTALEGLNARSYKNSTLLFNLARVFIAASPAASALINPPWTGLAEHMWAPVQIRHRSAYYDAFFAEALMDYLGSGLATPRETADGRRIVADLIGFCLRDSRETVRAHDGREFSVVTAIAPGPHARISRFFSELKADLGFGIYVPDCDTTACALSAATQFGSDDAILDQPMPDFYAGYQVGVGDNRERLSVPINDTVAFDGGIMTWIENLNGERPYGNDLDPTLGLDVLEVCFRNCARWRIVETPARLAVVRRIIEFEHALVKSGAFADPRSHIYYLPELYCAYFGRCYEALRALPPDVQHALDPGKTFASIRDAALAYVRDDLIAREMNAFDAALALLTLAKLEAAPDSFAPALACISASRGEGGWRAPFRAYEWNKMKTPTRILVGGAEVTSAFVLSALVHARRALTANTRGRA